jgi:spore maturation protein CgeB
MKALYIGQCNEGSTSKMRYDLLQELINSPIELINISPFLENSIRVSRSLAWRYYFGFVPYRINKEIKDFLKTTEKKWDFIWVDKGVFIYPENLKRLKSRTRNLVHYTPDTAFYANNSRHFRSGMNIYDWLITTKSFELAQYIERVSQKKILLVSQGYNPNIHYPRNSFEEKELAITFIGLCEPNRELLLKSILQDGYKVFIGGLGWNNFLKKNSENNKLVFLGEKIWDIEYASAISRSSFGMGLLSKKFPELHTTRTFEIPACGTCLITERNEEIDGFFSEDEAIKYSTIKELLDKLNYFSKNTSQLEDITKKGKSRIEKDQRDYKKQLEIILQKLA